MYDQMQKSMKDSEEKKPNPNDTIDLKTVIPYVKRKVLKGTVLVFSGIVPTHIPLRKSKAFMVARSLGAEIHEEIDKNKTTHLVAARVGTAKVNRARQINDG